jgi:hypothetical protein
MLRLTDTEILSQETSRFIQHYNYSTYKDSRDDIPQVGGIAISGYDNVASEQQRGWSTDIILRAKHIQLVGHTWEFTGKELGKAERKWANAETFC